MLGMVGGKYCISLKECLGRSFESLTLRGDASSRGCSLEGGAHLQISL